MTHNEKRLEQVLKSAKAIAAFLNELTTEERNTAMAAIAKATVTNRQRLDILLEHYQPAEAATKEAELQRLSHAEFSQHIRDLDRIKGRTTTEFSVDRVKSPTQATPYPAPMAAPARRVEPADTTEPSTQEQLELHGEIASYLNDITFGVDEQDLDPVGRPRQQPKTSRREEDDPDEPGEIPRYFGERSREQA